MARGPTAGGKAATVAAKSGAGASTALCLEEGEKITDKA
jgi:hypothetical protein